VNHLPIDPDAHRNRRAWLPCPNCHHGHDCPQCQNNHNCQTHWQYLLGNEGSRVSLQCPTCAHLWTVDTAQARRCVHDVVATIFLGEHARDLVVSPDGKYVYATTANSVNVIDRTHRVVANIPVGVHPKRTMVSADGSRVYVTGDDGSMSIINTVERTVKTVGGEATTAELVSPADNYVYRVHNQGRNCWVSVISDDGTTVAATPVDSYASALTLSPDGTRLYVASSKPSSTYQHGHGSICVIDTATFTLVDVIAMQFSPDRVTVSPDGSSVYVTHYNKNAISAIGLASRSHTLIGLDDAPLDMAVGPNDDHLYVTNLHSLALIDTATNVAESVPIGDLPRHLHFSGDGKRAYVTDLGHNVLWVLDAVDKTVITTVDLGRYPEAVAISADEQLLYVADYLDPRLAVISLPSQAVTPDREG
jgi:YVTN family beta-propeller protein